MDLIDSGTTYTNAVIGSLAPRSNSTDKFPPTLVIFWTTCTDPPPRGNRAEFIFGWVFAFLAFGMAIVISTKHLLKLKAEQASTRRDVFLRICGLTPVYAVCCLLGSTIPRGSLLWLEVMHVYEALVVQQFAELMLHFIFTELLAPASQLEAITAFSQRHGSPHDTAAFYHGGASDPGGYLDAVASVLMERSQPKRLLASAPLCCCFTLVGKFCPVFAEESKWLPCGRSILPTVALLGFVRAAIRAFVVGLPALAMVRLWAREAWDRPQYALEVIEQICSCIEVRITAVS